VIARIGYDFVARPSVSDGALPLWLFWFAWRGSNIAWRELLLTFHGARPGLPPRLSRLGPPSPSAGPVAIMVAALVAYRMQLAGRVMAYAGVGGVIVATALTSGRKPSGSRPTSGKSH